jgi:hypothetical protein
MSNILYYSNFCEHSKKLLQTLSRSNIQSDIHFICIDKRIKDPSNNKVYIVLENGQKIIMPQNISRVPALLLLNQGYNVLYGESILQQLKPKQEQLVKQATQNNMVPSAFSFDSGYGSVVSDHYSYLDQDPDSLKAEGNGGMRQMHNYVDINYQDSVTGNFGDDKKSSKMPKDVTIEQLQQQRDEEIKKINGNRPPMSF